MMKFSPNLTMLYTEAPFLERFERASRAGFTHVEFQLPYEAGFAAVKSRLDAFNLKAVLFNLLPGDTAHGELGTLSNPNRRDFFRSSFLTALEGAQTLGVGLLNTVIGQKVDGLEASAQVECAIENLNWALPQAQAAGVSLLIEPLNPSDFPNYFVHTTRQAMKIIEAVNHPNLKLQYDVYHAQMTEGNLINTLTACFQRLGHIQIADVPGRHQPGTGEINFPAVFAALEKLGYDGFIGLEYKPLPETDDSLGWMNK
jgi:hydroxypyruvate isomerase